MLKRHISAKCHVMCLCMAAAYLTGALSDGGLLIVEVFQIGQMPHPYFEMPILT